MQQSEGLELEFDGELEDIAELTEEEQKKYDDYLLEIAEQNKEKKWLINAKRQETTQLLSVIRETSSVFELYRKYQRYLKGEKEGTLVLNPSFQRGKVWSRMKQSELIESVLMGVPLPVIYLREDSKGNLIVVDGKQRLTSLFDFMDSKKGFALSTKLKYTSDDLKKKKFGKLEPHLQRKIEDYTLLIYIISSSTPTYMMNEIFMRVNRNGVTLTQQELRNAVYEGKSTELLDKISKNLNIVVKTRMKDKYLAIRFIGLFLWKESSDFNSKFNFEEDYKNMSEFLDKVMLYLNSLDMVEIDKLYTLFYDAYQKSIESLGDRAFKRADSKAVNMTIFEIWMYAMTFFDFQFIENNKHTFSMKYEEMVTDLDFIDNILFLRDMKERIKYRFDRIEELVDYFKVMDGE